MTEAFRLLVVDNEPQTTHVLNGALSRHEYQIRTAADGESALADCSVRSRGRLPLRLRPELLQVVGTSPSDNFAKDRMTSL